MRNISLLVFFVSLMLSAQAQEVVIDTSYYAPPPVVRQRLLKEDPDDNTSSREVRESNRAQQTLLNQLNEVQSWYVSAEGGLRSDISRSSNSFGGLVSNSTPTKVVWSVLVGYTYRNAWSLEAGYTRAPTHLNITIASNPEPLVFNYLNNGYGIPIRLKRRLGSGKQAANGTGFWVTGGAWLTPNGNSQTGDFKLIGYSYGSRNRVDTIRLSNTTAVFKSITGIAELGLDYAARLSPSLELGGYVRKYWGLGNALKSDLTYTVNNRSTEHATITADGSGWGFGITLRYIYGRQHEMKKTDRHERTLNDQGF
ncbi:hypothetical protein [Spirosoma oryzicola]|uniref:hypothetical protein n=1 Tax=Spirosoma oryzicola TaxID=2898794 RepID=UPI001E49C5CD|nr:hypothetical protein [Spirosoma oryzicola]UHG89520.1 hypothetical protein LQ777_14840 [Spirosoma oryzicola]